MASGLPIVCSDHGPMPEVLGDSGIYFNPLNVDSITNSLHIIIKEVSLRESLSELSWQRSKQYSWKKSANETFDFIHSIISKVKIK